MSNNAKGANQSGGPPLPEPRPGNSTTNPSAQELRLRAAADRYESTAIWAGVAVAIAVICEVPLILWPLESDGLQQACEALATLTIGIGVAAEVLFGKMASRRQGELLGLSNAKLTDALARVAQVEFDNGFIGETLTGATEELAKTQRSLAGAIKRAAKAERETERLRKEFGWRIITGEQAARFVTALQTFHSWNVNIWYTSGDNESGAYAYQFAHLLRCAGWPYSLNTGAPFTLEFGLRIPAASSDWGLALRSALKTAEIPFDSGPMPEFMSRGGTPLADPAVVLFVGPKRIPFDNVEEQKMIPASITNPAERA